MAGTKINDYSIGDSNIQSLMLTLDKAFKGQHQVSLTNYDNTSESQIAAGSVVECNGAQYKFDSNESITGSPSNGTVYIRLVPAGDTITAEYTKTAPTWSDSKQGWYGTGASANYRYLEFKLILDSTVWTEKGIFEKEELKTYIKAYADTDQNITGSNRTKINFSTKEYDFFSEFASSRFTATKKGLYLIIFTAYVQVTTADAGIKSLILLKNGSDYGSSCPVGRPSVTGFEQHSGTFIIKMDIDDYIEIERQQSLADVTRIVSGSARTFIEITKL